MNKYIKYRPEIDGLRAVAVLAVIFYHASLNNTEKFLSGGFLGVDIFFVISGYLITKIILNEIKKTNNFSLLNFYKRRIRRILPALLFVLILTFPIIYKSTLPNLFEDYLKSIISIILFVSNIFFWSLGYGYDQLGEVQFQPFLHTWTLSVEEQFYIFFPIFFIVFFRFFKEKIIYLILLFFLISLILSDYLSYTHGLINFYFLPSRAWELLAGSFLVFFEDKLFINKKGKNKIFFKNILVYFGTFLILFSLVFFDDKMYLPSIISFVPILGTCLLILFIVENNFVYNILTSNIAIAIGKISYSLYLWHYPIIILFPKINFFTHLIIIFGASTFTYYYVELKFRSRIKNKFFSIKTISITAIAIFILAFVFLEKNKNYNYELYPEILKNSLGRKEINLNKSLDLNQKINNSKKNIYIAGDSHMHVLSRELNNNQIIKKNYNLVDLNLSNGCYYLYGFYRIDVITKKKLSICTLEDQNERRNRFLEKPNSIVIIGGRLPLWLNASNYTFGSRYLMKKRATKPGFDFVSPENINLKDGIKYSINDLLENGVKVILIYPVPIHNFFPQKKIFDSYIYDKKNFSTNLEKKPFVSSYKNFLSYANESHELLNSLNHKNLYKIYTDKIFCNLKSDSCYTHDKQNIYYIDNNHLSASGNKLVIKEILKILKLTDD